MFKNRTFPRDQGLSPQIIIWGNEHLHSLISPSTHSGTDLTAKTQFSVQGIQKKEGRLLFIDLIRLWKEGENRKW